MHGNSVVGIRGDTFLPQRPRHDTEHGSTVKGESARFNGVQLIPGNPGHDVRWAQEEILWVMQRGPGWTRRRAQTR